MKRSFSTRPKFLKNQANTKQHLEAELLLFENYSHSSSTLSSKIIEHSKKNKQKNKYTLFYKHTSKFGWSSICLRFSEFEPEIMLDGMLNFLVWYCVWYEHRNGLF